MQLKSGVKASRRELLELGRFIMWGHLSLIWWCSHKLMDSVSQMLALSVGCIIKLIKKPCLKFIFFLINQICLFLYLLVLNCFPCSCRNWPLANKKKSVTQLLFMKNYKTGAQSATCRRELWIDCIADLLALRWAMDITSVT